MPSRSSSFLCPLCERPRPAGAGAPLTELQPSLMEVAHARKPGISDGSPICFECMNHLRAEFVQATLLKERGELTAIEQEVVRSLHRHDILVRHPDRQFEGKMSLGDRLSDRVASFGGSWLFISIFGAVLFLWVGVNTLPLLSRSFDPYPFIFLNLLLSCIAAIQAPVIMMSQNRQEKKDRLRAENDYRVNLKAELEIRHLNAKMDQLLVHQWHRLLEIQQIQTELLEQIAGRRLPKASPRKPR